MRLLDLEPQYYRIVTPKSYAEVHSIAGADGLLFFVSEVLCEEQGSRRHAYGDPLAASCLAGLQSESGRWEFLGTGYGDLTLKADSSSVFLSGDGGCQAHFFVKNGSLEDCDSPKSF